MVWVLRDGMPLAHEAVGETMQRRGACQGSLGEEQQHWEEEEEEGGQEGATHAHHNW